MRRRRLDCGRGTGSGDQTSAELSAATSRFGSVSTSDMADSARGYENHRGEHDHVDREYEQRGVPDVAQQTEAGRAPTKPNSDEPGGGHHHRHRRDIDAEKVDLGEPHPGAPASKYAACWMSP